MVGDVILNEWNPSEETLRRWALDEHLYLSEQDEDLALGRPEYLPLLIELADDPSCPKAEYILSSLDFYLMFLVLRGNESHVAVVSDAARLAAARKTQEVIQWGHLQERRLRYREGIGPVSKDLALLMGQELLNGICRQASISIVGESESTWEVELSVPPSHRHKERLSVSKASGRFRFSR
jgi:hypothetical protein